MAVKIELKRSSVPGKVPTTASLELGEIAINTYDGVAYLKREVNTTQSIVALLTTAFTGSYMESSSYARTASFAFFALSSSYAGTASVAPMYVLNSVTSSMLAPYLQISQTGSMLAPYLQISQTGSMTVASSSYAATASYFSGSISNATNAVSSSYALTASYINPANIPAPLLFQIATGSVTASVSTNINQIFLIKSGSRTVVGVDRSGSITTSGSITVNTTGSYSSLVSVNNNGTEYLKVNGEGVLVLNQFATPPTAVSGGLYLDTTGEFYFGV